MRVSIGFTGATPLPLTIAAVDAAETAGLSGVWSAEHVGMNDGIVPSAVYASRTERLEIGIMGLNADTRSPGVLAMEMATLCAIAPGRVRVQVGTGSPQRAAQLGVTGVRTVRGVETFTNALRGLLRGETVSASSEAFTLDEMRITTANADLAPVSIDIMAIRPKMTSLAARIADGLSLSVLSSHEYIRSQVGLVEQVLEEAERDRSEFRVSACVLTFVEQNIDTARSKMAAALASFPPGLPEMLVGLTMPAREAVEAAKLEGGLAQAAKLFSDATLDGLGLVATPLTLPAAIESYKMLGVDELIVMVGSSPESDPALIETLRASVSS